MSDYLFKFKSISGSSAYVWKCKDDDKKLKPICKKNEKVLYAWNVGASTFSLPSNMGYKIDPIYTHLIIQVHYKNKIENKDYSGIQ